MNGTAPNIPYNSTIKSQIFIVNLAVFPNVLLVSATSLIAGHKATLEDLDITPTDSKKLLFQNKPPNGSNQHGHRATNIDPQVGMRPFPIGLTKTNFAKEYLKINGSKHKTANDTLNSKMGLILFKKNRLGLYKLTSQQNT